MGSPECVCPFPRTKCPNCRWSCEACFAVGKKGLRGAIPAPSTPGPLEVAVEALEEMGAQLATQDNECTAHPIFLVEQRHRVYGFDTAYSDDKVAWVDSEGEATHEEREALEAKCQETGEEPDGWTRTGYVYEWRFVQPFFTRVGAERYIERNRHRMKDPRVFVDSAYRNDEWQAVRVHLATIRGAAGPAETPACLRTLSPQEMAQLKPLSSEEIATALEAGARDKALAEGRPWAVPVETTVQQRPPRVCKYLHRPGKRCVKCGAVEPPDSAARAMADPTVYGSAATRPGEAKGTGVAVTFEAREVLADAYPRRRAMAMLTHLVEVHGGRDAGVVCGRVRNDSLADRGSLDAAGRAARPTCPPCGRRWDRERAPSPRPGMGGAT